MDPSFWATIIKESATVALAVFAIWVLSQEYKDRLANEKAKLEAEREDHKEERAQLLAVIDRNTEGWHEASQAVAEAAKGMAALAQAQETTRQDISDIRVLLAQRPCVADGVIQRQGGSK